MIVIVGLGNPGKKFESTRHNVGFMAVNEFARKNNFPDFVLRNKFNAEISEGNFGGQEVMLVKPQTFMNDSGKAVRAITKPYTLIPKPLLVIIHDDIDLPVGKIKIVKDRGSAGHKGVESIIKAIGNEGLVRIRIGIAPQVKPEAIKIVLKKFSKEEKEIIDQAIQNASTAVEVFITQGLEKAMNEYNK